MQKLSGFHVYPQGKLQVRIISWAFDVNYVIDSEEGVFIS